MGKKAKAIKKVDKKVEKKKEKVPILKYANKDFAATINPEKKRGKILLTVLSLVGKGLGKGKTINVNSTIKESNYIAQSLLSKVKAYVLGASNDKDGRAAFKLESNTKIGFKDIKTSDVGKKKVGVTEFTVIKL